MTTELPTNFHEGLRYEYDLTPDSLVIDCGFYKGEFTMEMARRHDCRIDAYEPILEFWEQGVELTKFNEKTILENVGVAKNNTILKFQIKGGLTGQFNSEGESQEVYLRSIWGVIPRTGCEVLKLNVEGSEFEILEAICNPYYEKDGNSTDYRKLCKNIQVQFHKVVPNFQERYEAIRSKLLETHHLTFDFPWCWENYRRNDAN